MGEVIYLNKIRREMAAKKEKEIPIDPEDIELYNFFREVLAGFEERGFQVVDVLVIPNECPNSNAK